MKRTSARPLLFLVLLLVFIAGASSTNAQSSECVWKCSITVDNARCVPATTMGGKNYTTSSECDVYAYDPDGPGGDPPITFVQCTYHCNIEYCVWV